MTNLVLGKSDAHLVIIPNMAELSAAQMVSRRDGHSCQPSGLDHGFEYASSENAS